MQIDRSLTSLPHSPGKTHLAAARSTIVCGTDFSEAAAQSVEVAAALAQRLGEPLVLAHAVNEGARENLPGELRDSLSLYARSQLHADRESLQAMGVELVEALQTGPPAAVLLEVAAAEHARLLVLTPTKRRSLSHWLHGHVIERVIQANRVPTLTVRNSLPLVRWARGKQKLRVFVVADFSQASEAALRWVDWLRQVGPCQVVVTCLESRPVFHPSLNSAPSPLVDDYSAKLGRMQERYFRQRVRTLLVGQRVRVRFEPMWGRSDAHLIQMATEERADLIVVGTEADGAWQLTGHHSVSRGVLHYAPHNVVCVPVRPNGPTGLAPVNHPPGDQPPKP